MSSTLHEKILYCYNCYNLHHVSKNCPHPVFSYGVVCYKIIKDEIHYLMVERKHSFAFVEFLMGKYDMQDVEYIQDLFEKMTLFERCLTTNHSFKFLWCKLWGQYRNQQKNSHYEYKKSIQREFCRGSIKFHILKNGFINVEDNKTYALANFVENSENNHRSPEWYFPKGKRLCRFEPIDVCALREFKEETGIDCDELENIIPHIPKVSETHQSTNKKTYTVTFFIVKYQGKEEKKFQQVEDTNSEINSIAWLTFDECIKKFRHYEVEKKQLMKEVNDIVLVQEEKKKNISKNKNNT